MTDNTSFIQHIAPCDWLKTPDYSVLPANRYFCVVKGQFSQCSSFEVKMQPVTTGDDTAFTEFEKIGDTIVGDGYIILFTKGTEVPGCLSIRFAKRCLRL